MPAGATTLRATEGCRLVPGYFPRSSRKVPGWVPSLKFSTSVSQNPWKSIYLMFPGGAIVGISSFGYSIPFSALQREILRVGPSSLGFMAISDPTFPSSLPPLRWSQPDVCARCPGFEWYKYQDCCCSLSSASTLESQAYPVYQPLHLLSSLSKCSLSLF